MSTPYLIAIAAMSRNRVIGKDGCIPWTCKEDMAWFKRTTLNRPVIMGWKTWVSLGKRPLEKRWNVVISSLPPSGDGSIRVSGREDLMQFLEQLDPGFGPRMNHAYIIGGAQTYTALMPWTREILLTVIDIEVEGDTHFPEIPDEFELKSTTPLSERAVVHHYVRR